MPPTKRTPNPTFPDRSLNLAQKSLLEAYRALGGARDHLSDARDPTCTALGGPDRVKLDASHEATNSMRERLEEAVRGIEHILQTRGCGPTSDEARRGDVQLGELERSAPRGCPAHPATPTPNGTCPECQETWRR